MKGKSLKGIAELVKGEVRGNDDKEILGITNIEEASENDITFAVHPNIEKAIKSKAGAVIIARGTDFSSDKDVIIVENPREAFAILLDVFRKQHIVKRTIDSRAVVADTAIIGKNVSIMPYAVIDEGANIGDNSIIYPHAYIGQNVSIGKDCIFYSNVSVYADCQIGDRVTIHSGASIGGDGFGYVTIDGKHRKVPQVGNVILGDDVEVGCNSCVDCATTGSTVIGNGTKIDNLVHIGHNDVLGENCLVVAHVGLSGSITVGNNVTFAGQVATVGHIKIGNNCVFAGRSGITADVPDNSVYAGFPAGPHKEWLKQEVARRKLPELISKIKKLEKKVDSLEKK